MAKEKSKHKVRSMEIRHADDGSGFTITTHHKSEDRGEYIPSTDTIAKHHGEVMHHVHEYVKDMGAEEAGPSGQKNQEEHQCEMCEQPEGEASDTEVKSKDSKGGKDKGTVGEAREKHKLAMH